MPIFASASKTRMNLFADDFALGFGLRDAGELCEETVFGVHTDKMDIPLGKRRFDPSPSSLRIRPWSTNTHVS